MRVLVLGGTGQLGRGFVSAISDLLTFESEGASSHGVTGLTVVPRNVDISDLPALKAVVLDSQPDWIVNAAAYTQVDAAEIDPYRAILTNVAGAANAALCAKAVGARLIYFSTESVFDGSSKDPYIESDVCNPLSIYSISKQGGEQVTSEISEDSYVIRTSWLYGDSVTANFPARLLANLSATEGPVPVVTDLVGNPTPVTLLVEATLALVHAQPNAGTYHVCTGGSATKYEWARAIAESQGFSKDRITPALSSDFFTAARRSAHVILSNEKFLATGLLKLPDWRDYYPVSRTIPDS